MKLLKMLNDDRKMNGAIMTTFPFDSNFYEHHLNRSMSKKGIGKNNVVLVDSGKYVETLEGEYNRAKHAGDAYHLAPIDASGKRVFHPKIFFFAGDRRVYVFVGSANLTQKGITDNAELVSYFEYERKKDDNDPRHLSIIKDIRSFLSRIIYSSYAEGMGDLPRKQATEEVLDSCNWLEDVETEDGHKDVEFIHNLDDSILDQFIKAIERPEDIEEVHLMAPYYGESIQVLEELADMGEPSIRLYLQQNKSIINQEKLKNWISNYEDASITLFSNKRFFHGKLLLAKTTESAYVLTGSPNPSYKGMLCSSNQGGNIEAGIIRHSDDPSSFDHLLKEDLLEEVAHDLAEFEPDNSLEYEDASEEEAPEFELRSVTYRSLSGIPKLIVSGYIQDASDGFNGSIKIESLGEESTEFDIEAKDLEDGQFEVKLPVQENQDVFENACKAFLLKNGKKSQPRWVDKDLPKKDQMIEEAIQSTGTANIPRQMSEYLLSDEEKTRILSMFSQYVQGVKTSSTDSSSRSGSRRGTTAPPTLDNRSKSSDEPEDIITNVYETWYGSIVDLTNKASLVDAEDQIDDLARILNALNKCTANLQLAHTQIDNVDLEKLGIRIVPRKYMHGLYTSDDKPVPEFCSNILNTSVDQEDVETFDTSSAYQLLFEQVLPQILFAALVKRNEDPSKNQGSLSKYVYPRLFNPPANSCLEAGRPTPSLLIGDFDDLVDNLVEISEDAFLNIKERSDVEQHIEENYLDEDELEDFLIRIFAYMLVSRGEVGIESFYNELFEELSKEEADRKTLGRLQEFSGHVWRNIRDLKDEEADQIYSCLSSQKDDWQSLDISARSILTNVLPQDQY